MTARLIVIGSMVALLVGCGKTEAPKSSSNASAVQVGEKPVEGTDASALLAPLTQTLRKFSAEKQRVPKSLQELVAAGYLPSLPTAPGGKKFLIDEKRVEVVLAD